MSALRMSDWLLQALVWFTLNKLPVLIPASQAFISVEFQAIAWRFGVLSISAYLGFFLDRAMFGEMDHAKSPQTRKLCRAITVGSFLVASALVV